MMKIEIKKIYDKIEKEHTKTNLEESVEEQGEDVRDLQKGKEMREINTDSVEKEIAALKKKRDNLLKEISSLSDTASSDKLESLKKKLEEVKRELLQKDNHGYKMKKVSCS